MRFWYLSKRTIKTIGSVIFLTAIIHLVVMIVNAVYFKDVKILNYFRVLSLDTYFPKITKGYLSDIISVIIITVLFLLFWFFKKRVKIVK